MRGRRHNEFVSVRRGAVSGAGYCYWKTYLSLCSFSTHPTPYSSYWGGDPHWGMSTLSTLSTRLLCPLQLCSCCLLPAAGQILVSSLQLMFCSSVTRDRWTPHYYCSTETCHSTKLEYILDKISLYFKCYKLSPLCSKLVTAKWNDLFSYLGAI